MSSALRISGVYSAMMTPFDQNGDVHEQAVRQIVEFLVDKRADGVFPVSNVGEYIALSMDERQRLIELTCEVANGRLIVLPGVSDISLKNAKRLCQLAKAAGAQAVVLAAPCYYPYPEDYLRRFLFSVAEDSPLPVVFYNSPKFTNPVPMDALLELLAHQNVIALKESSADMRFFQTLMAMIRARDLDVDVLMGFEELTLSGMVHGAVGSITSCGGVIPEILRRLVDSFNAGDLETASGCAASVERVASALAKNGFPFGYKLGVRARGIDFALLQSGFADVESRYEAQLAAIRGVIAQELSKL